MNILLQEKLLKNKQKKLKAKSEKQVKAIEAYEKQLLESNELTKKDFSIDRDRIPLKEQNKIFNVLVEERSSEFKHLEKE